MRNILLLALALGLAAAGAGCLNDGDDGASGTAGEDPDAVDQMDRDAREESVAGESPGGDEQAQGNGGA